MGIVCKKSALFKLNLQCFTEFLSSRHVSYCAMPDAQYKSKIKRKYV